MDELSYDELRKAQLKERHYSALQKLGEDYFDEFSSYVSKLEARLGEKYSGDDARAYENAFSVFKDLVSRRKHKIVLKALRDSRNDVFVTDGLARQEKKLYESLMGLFGDYSRELGFSRKPEPEKAEKEEVAIRILMDLPQFMASDTSFGPFSKGQEVVLPVDAGALLLKRKAAEKVKEE